MRWVAAIASMLAVAVGAGSARAQDVIAEVRTWTGQSWRLSGSALDVYHTVFETAENGGAPGDTTSLLPPPPSAGPLELRGSMKALSSFVGKAPASRFAQRPADAVTVFKDGVETRVPLTAIDTMRFMRERVAGSSLPPYLAPSHVRHSVIVVLRDGSRLDADYVNLGTAVLRGATPQGRVEIPWGEIEMVRFVR